MGPYAVLNGIPMPVATHSPSGLGRSGSGSSRATAAGSARNRTI